MQLLKFFQPLGIILIFNIAFSDAVIFKFSNFVCKSHNESWFIFHNCRLKAVSRERILLNMNGTILYAAHSIQVHIKMWKRANGFKPFLLDSTVDACRFLKSSYDPFAKIVYNIFKDFSNINHTCPYVGPQIVTDFYLRPELLLLPFPSGEFLLSMQWYFYKKPQFDTNVTFIFMEDLLKRN
ncbi:uncharacterized protein Dana_GF14709 [Drosophila ananassae]|uniref:MD-2-related lipid-recognition domain-containing protein n=1 Tax=Drosophila ananassae TaxID=7217 RepID=B3MNN2_DROAN|nr:uncharacterized protein LOC6497530 [Drosophila ananassae]EDV31119.2 uncharacterized protein Dana_GF14709 [Drosophila ananassae]